jgi:outer membrane protein assembly factor BamB
MDRVRSLRLPAALGAIVLLALAGCGGDSSEDGSGTTASATTGSGGSSAKLINWRLFGRVSQRTHYLPAPERFNPPLKSLWSFSDRVLIEFPPAVFNGVAYVADKYGDVRAIRLEDRKVLWDIQKDHRDVGPPTDVTAPVYSNGRVFVAFEGGFLAALDSATGEVAWKRDLHSHLESSPLVIGDTLYVGSDKSHLFAIDTANGKVRWQFTAPSPIKASPSFDRGRIFVGDYSGTMYCLDSVHGKVVWQTDTTKIPPGGTGGFYSSPAIAFGKVYDGRDDGTIYAFDARTGKKAWSFETGDDVYGSPAVAKVPKTPPTVYIGSYDSHLYALRAADGKEEWKFDVGGQVPGTATVIGHTVYTSSFQTQKSIGIDVLTHRKTFSFDSPGYTPMISDGQNLYLVGYFTLHGLAPR